MARSDFINQLRELGFNPEKIDQNKICFDYKVPVGKNIDKIVCIGFESIDDFPMNCPHGPHFKSIGIEGWIESQGGIHQSPFGSEWRHWSRPFKEWNNSNKTVKEYMSHIRNILMGV